jgi:2,3-bisphosphoglycerate-independent phosphoglycerate mutase
MTKTVFIIVDGMADLPIRLLKNKTPLDYAIKTNLYRFLKYADFAYPKVLGKFAPQSDSGVMADLGYNPLKYSTGRGWFECLGLNMRPKEGELCIRVNFGSIINGRLNSVRTYMSKQEIEGLSEEINRKVKVSSDFEFKAGEGYRAGLIFHPGKNMLSSFVSNNEPGYTARFFGNEVKLSFATGIKDKNIRKIKAIKKEARYTAELLNDFVSKAAEVIKNSKICKERKKMGLDLPNYLFLRDAANKDPRLYDINKKYGKKWAAVVGMPLEKGIATSAGMALIDTSEEKDIRKDFYDKVEKTVKALSKFDAVYLHIKQTDSVSHLGKFRDKYAIIESIDKIIISKLANSLDLEQDTLVLTCDHATSSELRRHINSNIPVLISNKKFGFSSDFSEVNCSKNHLKEIRNAVDIMPFVMSI